MVFLGNDVQIGDINKFCCQRNGILSIDATYNLCDNWLTDSSYKNKRLLSNAGRPFLGPSIIHFQKDVSVFKRFLLELVSGTDLDKAIYNGFKSFIPDLKLLLCV